ncbi:hypothetical protein M406DRAFT_55875 [Cryphonectria parasitica EP155]|uniref:Uncharacterized protein n=1 Tax=Cryphonectria parasitica (strain ATCC 38755 / EP155) TaxID=660469 RepID=A0A9P5CP34_CRYP1|nr:uncharacterized protein M406DRAFT_55875 [Cryphonectria parasitica EP155]KAF3764570.1 hypothetical protein M406DRAFT_55875 [Cryphonectria parasitica EP155]
MFATATSGILLATGWFVHMSSYARIPRPGRLCILNGLELPRQDNVQYTSPLGQPAINVKVASVLAGLVRRRQQANLMLASSGP